MSVIKMYKQRIFDVVPCENGWQVYDYDAAELHDEQFTSPGAAEQYIASVGGVLREDLDEILIEDLDE